MEDTSVEDTPKVGSQGEEEKEVIVEEIKSSVELGEEVAAAADDNSASAIETQVSEAIIEKPTNSDEQVAQTEETKEPAVSENVEETTEVSEVVVESVELMESLYKEPGDGTEASVEDPLASENVEIQSMKNPEEGLPSPEETTSVVTHEAVKGTLEEPTTEPSSVVTTETTREETEAVETIKDLAGDEGSKPPSLEDNDGSLSAQTDRSSLKSDEGKVVPPTTSEAVPEKIEEETKLPISDIKTEESLVIHDPSKENVPAAETTSTTVQERNANIASATQRQHNSCTSCCGLLELLIGVDR